MIYINSKLTVNTTIDMLIICDIIYIIMLEVVEEVERKQVFSPRFFFYRYMYLSESLITSDLQ